MVSDVNDCSHNPNFPLNLDIYPSTIPNVHSENFADLSQSDEQFGSAAQQAAIEKYGIAGRVWEAAYAMIMYIQSSQTIEFDPPFFNPVERSASSGGCSMLELGSGNGLVVSTLLKSVVSTRDHIIATDLPEVCPLLQANISSQPTQVDISRAPCVTVAPLSWGNYDDVLALPLSFNTSEVTANIPPLTHIICSDLIYFPHLLGPLFRSLLHLTSPPLFCLTMCSATNPPNPTIVISYKLRSLVKEMPFWSAFGLWFNFFPVLAREKSGDQEWRRFASDFADPTYVFRAHRRLESYEWRIPASDEELLSGIGAQGTDIPKGDDTFETLLLMSLD